MSRGSFVLLRPTLLGSCAPLERPVSSKPVPPYAACLPKPAPLPPIATIEQVRAGQDRLDMIYADCAARLRADVEMMKK